MLLPIGFPNYALLLLYAVAFDEGVEWVKRCWELWRQ